LPDDEQEALLLARSASDPDLVATVRAMLREDRADSILDRDLAETAHQVLGDSGSLPDSDRRRFGPYEIQALLGEGGMGLVYLARREDLGSVAAIKVLRDAWISPSRQERFAAEQRTLAQLVHESIARLYDAGALDDGTPWLAMEYVEGVPLTEHCAVRGASVAERLGLFAAVCEAVQHAHQHLVIHRDLKPSNILVTRTGSIKLLDFGIAKQLQSLDPDDDQTRTALRLLTPAYAAPEQLRGERIGVYTDVYALGVVLYELLAGRLPYDVSRRSPGELEAAILGTEPVRPSLAGRSTPHGRVVGRSAWSDLDVLCLTAMQKDPARRYPTVAALTRDVKHYLAGEPLEARPEGAAYRLGKFARRNRVPLFLAAVVLAVLVSLVTFYTVRLRAARNAAVAEANKAQRILRFTLNLFQGGDKEAGPADTLQVVTLVDRGLLEARSLGSDPDLQSEMFETLGSIYEKLGNLARAESLLTHAVDQRRARTPKGSAELTRSLLALGELRIAQARFEEAERLIREAIATGRATLTHDHPALAEATSALAQVLQERGRYDDAIVAAGEAVGRYRAAGRPDGQAAGESPELAAAMARMADAHFYAGHYASADSINQQVLGIYRRLYGDRHPLIAQTLINLGAAQQERGNYAEAERYHRQGLEIIRGFYGEDHHETAYALTMLARAMIFEEKFGEADSLLRRALVVKERVYGPDHPTVASTVNELGNVALAHGRPEDAERYFTRMIAIYRKAYGGKHYLLGIAQANLASVYMRREEWPRAEQLFRQVVALYAETLGPDHINMGITRIKLGRTLLRQRRYADAAAESQAGYDILSKQANPAVSFLRAARTDLAAAYTALGQPEKAAKFKAELPEARP
jgi:serine/threonine protein kinase/tetratricopeptide (TPR) repeat protein